MKYIRLLLIALLALALPCGALAASASLPQSRRANQTSSAATDVSARLAEGGEPEAYAVAGSKITAYISKNTYIYKKASTSSSRKAVKVNTKVYVVGKSGGFLKVKKASGSGKGYVLASCVSKGKVSTKGASWKSKVVKMDWFDGGSGVLDTGSYGYIYDIGTGITLRIKRMGGHNHADVEPATASDTAKLKKIAGGSFSWDSHAVILRAGGKYVACSINTMPHGDQTITNNKYNGQFCLHMTGSTTHENDAVNANHQEAIEKAYNWAH